MDVRAAVDRLAVRLGALRGELEELQLHCAADRPPLASPDPGIVPLGIESRIEGPERDHYLASELSDAITECAGLTEQAMAAAQRAQRSAGRPVRWHEAIGALSACRAAVSGLKRVLVTGVG